MKPYGIEIDSKGLRGTRWQDFVLRFLLGGVVTAAAGLIAKFYGPVAGGLFLAFPAIFPASATLIEKHEIAKKARSGFDGERRGIEVAGIDAGGTAIGTIGLMVFGVVVWRLIEFRRPWLVLISATGAWLVTVLLSWLLLKRFKRASTTNWSQ